MLAPSSIQTQTETRGEATAMVSVEIPRGALRVACATIIAQLETAAEIDLSEAARSALLKARRQTAGFLLVCPHDVAGELSQWFHRPAEPLLASPDADQQRSGVGCRHAADWLGRAIGD